MKKTLYSVMAIAALTFSFTSLTSCEDVPAPYEIPGEGDNPGAKGTLPYNSASLSDWNAVTVKGAAWSLGSSYAKATGYNSTDKTYSETEAWLVSPTINTGSATAAVINFDHVIRYVMNDNEINNHELYISSDYAGDVKTATWTKLGYKPVASATNTWDFYAANTITVPTEYLGKDVVVAFKFVCGSSNSTTWEVKNFSVTEGTGGDEPTTPDQPSVDPTTPAGNNILANGDCEAWDGSTPVNWKTASSAGNASLSQSTDAHGGSYSISVGFNASQNKRLGYKEITLKAGTYKFSFYAKSTTADKSQCRPGYVFVTDGKADTNYNYGDYVAINNNGWTLVTYEFTLTETKTLCLVVMNPKTSNYATAQNILIDDASLVTSDGGFAE